MATPADRNLLFGILALQMDFISREQLVAAMNGWVLAKEKPLGQILVDQKALGAERRTLLEALVQEHLKLHDNDAEKSLAAIGSAGTIKEDLARVDDAGLHASLARVPAAAAHDPYLTVAQSVGASTSTGSRFRIVRPHARGGLGEVFVAEDEELHREVAVKQIQDRHADDPESRQRFVQEAEITGGLEHPGIVPVYGLGNYADGRPYYAMRFIRGDSLKDAIKRFHDAAAKQRSPTERAIELRSLLGRFLDVCNAIEYAHSRGVLHRDLKPGNIMLGKYGETLVVDWGLAKAVDRPDIAPTLGESKLTPTSSGGTAPTQMGSAIGTPQYMSPEQAAGRLDLLGPASDVYSLGATLYCLLTGKAPYEDADLGTLLQRVGRGDFTPPQKVNSEVGPSLDAICRKALALEPAARYASPAALADDIEHWLADEPVAAYRESVGERVARWTRRHRAWAQAIGVATALVAIVAVIASVLIAQSWRNETAARIEAEHQRAEADRGFQQARQAVNDYLTLVSESTLLNVSGLQPLRKELLRSALTYYQKFLEEHPDDPSLGGELALAGYRVGLIDLQLGDREGALKALQNELPLQEQLAKQSSSGAAILALSDTYNQLGNIAQQTAALAEARAWFLKSLETRKQLVADHPADSQFRRKMANADDNLATVDGRLKHEDLARREFDSATEIRSKLVEENPDQPEFSRDLAQGYYNQGVYWRNSGHLAAALEPLDRAAAIFEKLIPQSTAANSLQSIDVETKLVQSLRGAGEVAVGLQKWPDALAFYDRARQIAEPLARRNPFLVEMQAEVAASYTGIGICKMQAGATAEALDQYQRARDIRRQLVDNDPDSTRYRIDLATTLMKLAAVERILNHPVEAAANARERRKLWPGNAAELYSVAGDLALSAAAVGGGASPLSADQATQRRDIVKQTIEALQEAVAAGYKNFDELRADPRFKTLAADPAFKEFLQKHPASVK